MQIKNSNTRYGGMAILLHWIMVILIIGMLILGIYMANLPISLEKLKFYGWHKEYGVLVFMLVILRLVWRLTNTTPKLSLPLLEKIVALSVHWAFYGFMVAMPITGWLITSVAGMPISFFGWFIIPNLIAADNRLMELFQEIHKWLGYSLIAIIVLHTCAALKHHFINKDDILKRMLP